MPSSNTLCFQAHRRKFEKLKSFMNFDMIYKYNFQVLSSSSQNNFYNNHTSQCTNAIYQLHKRSMLLLPYILQWIEDTILGPRNHLDQHWDRVSVRSTPQISIKFESLQCNMYLLIGILKINMKIEITTGIQT